MSNKTVLFDKHIEYKGKIVDFAGWQMPVNYGSQMDEHHQVRKDAGMFDVSHMGRFIIKGPHALDFLQFVLTNNAAALEIEEGQYTMIPNENGGALDDAYLYRFVADEYLLVVNAANRHRLQIVVVGTGLAGAGAAAALGELAWLAVACRRRA